MEIGHITAGINHSIILCSFQKRIRPVLKCSKKIKNKKPKNLGLATFLTENISFSTLGAFRLAHTWHTKILNTQN
jgi:hypothetical protein